MKNPIFLFVIFFLSCLMLVSQSLPSKPTGFSNLDHIAEGRNPGLDFVFQKYRNQEKYSMRELVGSPFLDENFKRARIYSHDGLEAEVLIRYDGYNDEVQLKEYKDEEKAKMLVKDENIYCVLDNTLVRYRAYLNKKGVLLHGYLFQLYTTEKLVLFQRNIKEYKEGKEAISSFELPVPDKFIYQNELYIELKDKEGIIYLKPSKKEVLNLFKGKEKMDVKEFIEDSGLNVKDVDDVIRILKFSETFERDN